MLCLFSLTTVMGKSQSTPTSLRIDPANARSGTVSQLFDEINYIPLETTKESLFGDIYSLVVTDKYFIIMDVSTTSILLFDKKGKYHAKITNKKLTIKSLVYEKNNDRILVYLINEKAITPEAEDKMRKNPSELISSIKKYVSARYYDTDGMQLIDSVPDTAISISSVTASKLWQDFTASDFYLADTRLPDSTAYQLNIYKKGKLYKSYFPYNTKKDIATCGGFGFSNGLCKSKNDSTIYFTRPFDYSIYKLTPNTINPIYKFIFPLQNTVPQSYFKDSVSTEAEFRKYLTANPGFITGLNQIHLFNGFLLFKINNNESGFDQSNSFIYNLKSGDLISVNKSTPDKQNSYLPFLGNSFSNESFSAIDNKYLFNHVSSLEMFQAKEKTAGKNPVFSPVLENYFQTQNRKSNPVIVELKLKENL